MTLAAQLRARAEALDGFPGATLPEATPEVIARADEIAAGTVFFYDRTPVAVGLRSIDWSGGHVPHQEWPAQLNRFFHLTPLAAAYLETRDEKYARAARSYIQDWIAAREYTPEDGVHGRLYAPKDGIARPVYAPAPTFHPGDSGLNMSIRLGTSQHAGWGGMLPAFLASTAFDDAFLAAMIDSMSTQARFLAQHLTDRGNWRVSELDALVFTALRLPWLEGAAELLEVGITRMRNALATQFLPDGVHIERTPGYATWMTQVAASYVELAPRFPEADAKVDPAIVAAALDYAAHAAWSGLNDSGVVPRDLPEIGELALRRSLLAQVRPGEEAAPAPPLDQVFPDAGQIFVRTGWEPGAEALAFDASTWGGGHSHLSRLSFSFRSGGRLLVADPGILNYEMSDPLAAYGKSTRAHSTVNVNGLNQGPVDAILHAADFTPQTVLIHASYEGSYWEGKYAWSFPDGLGRGIYGRHERILFWLRGEYLLCLDRVETEVEAMVHNCWQLGPMEGWESDEASRAWWSRNADTNLLIRLLTARKPAEMSCVAGRREPLRGWIGAHGHDAVPAPSVEFRYPAAPHGFATSAVLLVPFDGPTPQAYKSVVHRAGPEWVLGITIPSGEVDYVGWSPRLEAPVEPVTDSPFLWLRTRAGVPMESYVLRGSHLVYPHETVWETPDRCSQLWKGSEA